MDFFALKYSFATLCLIAAVSFFLGRWSKSDGPARSRKPIGEVRTQKPVAKRRRSDYTSHTTREPVTGHGLSDDAIRKVEDLLSRGRLIAAIKVVRSELGIGLKDAKDFVDNWRRNR